MRSDHVCDLVLEACDLLERAEAAAMDQEALLDTAAHLRAQLCDAVATCTDEAVAADGRSALCELDALVGRLASPPTAVPQAA